MTRGAQFADRCDVDDGPLRGARDARRLCARALRVPRQGGPLVLVHLEPHDQPDRACAARLPAVAAGRTAQHASRSCPHLSHVQPADRRVDLHRPVPLDPARPRDSRRGWKARPSSTCSGASTCRSACPASPSRRFSPSSSRGTNCSTRSCSSPARTCKTAPVVATNFMSGYELPWGKIMATGTVIVLPVTIFALLVCRHMVRGLTMGATK